jgi:hypothetical protein
VYLFLCRESQAVQVTVPIPAPPGLRPGKGVFIVRPGETFGGTGLTFDDLWALGNGPHELPVRAEGEARQTG